MRRSRSKTWANRKAPSLEEIDALAAQAFADLPEPFRTMCDGVAILVSDFPDDATLAALNLESPFDLLGLYHGIDLTRATTGGAQDDIDRIFLYRRPILDYWAEHDEPLDRIITHVLIHEIGHHFGLSDDDMHRIEDQAD